MFQNIPSDKILDVVRREPTIPSKIAKEVGGDTLIVGAILSTLIENKQICVSHVKIGGSPIYYIPTDKHRLEEFIKYLNEKDRMTFNLLKEQRVLKDSDQDPLIRVSLNNLKDFAKEIIINNEKVWIFYDVTEEELDKLNSKKNKLEKNIDFEISNTKDDFETEKDIITSKKSEKEKITDKDYEKEELNSEIKTNNKKIIKKVKNLADETNNDVKKIKNISDGMDFLERIKIYLHNKKLDIITIEKIKKTEYTLILKDHSENKFIYCRAKDKKTLNDGDIAPAIIFAENKNMPCLFLTTGNLSKKTDLNISKEKNFKLERIE